MKSKSHYYKAPGNTHPKFIKTSSECSEVIIWNIFSNRWERFTSDRPYPDDSGESLTESSKAEWNEHLTKSTQPYKSIRT